MFCGHKTSAAAQRAFNVKNSPGALCGVFYVVGGVKGGMYTGSCRDVEGIVKFPQWHPYSLSFSFGFMSLERCLSCWDSSADCDLYSHKSCTVADLGPYFILTLIIEMRHLGVRRNPVRFLAEKDELAVMFASNLGLVAFGKSSRSI